MAVDVKIDNKCSFSSLSFLLPPLLRLVGRLLVTSAILMMRKGSVDCRLQYV